MSRCKTERNTLEVKLARAQRMPHGGRQPVHHGLVRRLGGRFWRDRLLWLLRLLLWLLWLLLLGIL